MPLNYPWYTYPNIITSSYKDFEHYRKETTRLYDFLNDLSTNYNGKTLVHLTIGAAMEEYLHHCNPECEEYKSLSQYQWRQLFPFWLQLYIENNPSAYVEIIIVSPNKQFWDEYYSPLLFIEKTLNKMKWIKENNRKYTSSTYPNIRINVFYTPFPHMCERNAPIIERYKRTNVSADVHIFETINECVQTIADRQFVNSFYTTLENMFINISRDGGFISCYSFAVFNMETTNSRISNFEMFSNVKKIISKLSLDQTLICEWYYKQTCYCMINLSTHNQIQSYVEVTSKLCDGYLPIFTQTEDNIVVEIIEADKFLLMQTHSKTNSDDHASSGSGSSSSNSSSANSCSSNSSSDDSNIIFFSKNYFCVHYIEDYTIFDYICTFLEYTTQNVHEMLYQFDISSYETLVQNTNIQPLCYKIYDMDSNKVYDSYKESITNFSSVEMDTIIKLSLIFEIRVIVYDVNQNLYHEFSPYNINNSIYICINKNKMGLMQIVS